MPLVTGRRFVVLGHGFESCTVYVCSVVSIVGMRQCVLRVSGFLFPGSSHQCPHNNSSITDAVYIYIYIYMCVCCGPGSVVGIATRYGLDGPGIESRWGRNFPHPCRPALGPT